MENKKSIRSAISGLTLRSVLPLCILAFAFCGLANRAEAASLYFNQDKKDVAVGEVFPLEILLNADNSENLNAVNLQIAVQNSNLKLRDWSDGGSIINFWAQRPEIDQNGNLTFQGVVLGGFNGKNGKILTLNFEALKTGKVTLNFKPITNVYLNDGKGTLANLKFSGAIINIGSANGHAPGISTAIDTTPPEILEAQISNSQDVYNGQYFLALAAQDNGSGIDYIEVKEGDGSWVRAESPYLLTNQKLDQDIVIRAMDKNGNARIETLKLKQYQLTKNIIYIFASFVVVLVAVWQIIKRRKAKLKKIA
jgi:hypothetical protein